MTSVAKLIIVTLQLHLGVPFHRMASFLIIWSCGWPYGAVVSIHGRDIH